MMAGAGKFSNVVSQEAKASAAMELTKSSRNILVSAPRPRFNPGGGALRVKISRGARLEVQNGTQQDLNEIIDLVNLGGKKIIYMLKMGGGGGSKWDPTRSE